jgi:hypothetical protein
MTVRRVYAAILLLALLLAACRQAQEPSGPGALTGGLDVGLEVSALDAPPGALVGVAVWADPQGASRLGGVQGRLKFDPGRVRFVGQVPEEAFAIVNAADTVRGALRIASLDVGGLPHRTVHLVFQVKARGYLQGLGYQVEAAGTTGGEHWARIEVDPAPRVDSTLSAPGDAEPLLLADWRRLRGGATARPARVPGEYRLNLRYGDATLDGVIDIIGDAFYVANVSVGNAPLIAGTDAPPRDAVIAANVDPANLPGLGEPGDPAPPGRNENGTFSIDIFDAVAVANAAVGNPGPIAGQLIPGRGPVASLRVVVSGTLPAGVTRTFTADTIYELQGTVNVPGSTTLVIEAGTRIEGDQATRGAIVVRRGGNIVARGTRLQPIVFSCTAATKVPGCWGGVVINGLALLNNGQLGVGDVDVNGCPERPSLGNDGLYGGCLVQDTSGVLRYVRIEYAGAATTGGATPGLALLGVGSGTVVDSLQVLGSMGDGVFVSGGRVDLRYLVLSDNAGDGLHWDDGWQGRGQFLLVQQGMDHGNGIHGSNYAPNPDAGPRSAPQLYHVTVVGPPVPAEVGRAGDAILLENGTAGIIRDAILLRPDGAGLNVNGTASCARTADSLDVSASIFSGGHPDYADDPDCLDEAAFAGAPSRGNRQVDPALVAPFSTVAPDFRPSTGSPAGTGYLPPPSDLFFDLAPTFVGAVAPSVTTGSNIPWYAGWAVGWP